MTPLTAMALQILETMAFAFLGRHTVMKVAAIVAASVGAESAP